MLIAIFSGMFGILMAFLTAIRISWEGGGKRRGGGEAPGSRVIPRKERDALKLHPSSGHSVGRAFSDLWQEILKGA